MQPITALVVVTDGGAERKLTIDLSTLRDCTEEAIGNVSYKHKGDRNAK
jgi:hypothetical protein